MITTTNAWICFYFLDSFRILQGLAYKPIIQITLYICGAKRLLFLLHSFREELRYFLFQEVLMEPDQSLLQAEMQKALCSQLCLTSDTCCLSFPCFHQRKDLRQILNTPYTEIYAPWLVNTLLIHIKMALTPLFQFPACRTIQWALSGVNLQLLINKYCQFFILIRDSPHFGFCVLQPSGELCTPV